MLVSLCFVSFSCTKRTVRSQRNLNSQYCSVVHFSLSLSLSPSPPLSQFKYCFSLCGGGSHWLASEISYVEKKINEVQTNCHLLQEQVKQAIDDFKRLLDTRQTVSFILTHVHVYIHVYCPWNKFTLALDFQCVQICLPLFP